HARFVITECLVFLKKVYLIQVIILINGKHQRVTKRACLLIKCCADEKKQKSAYTFPHNLWLQ
ncbi:hypothetical protein ABK670_20250, partial [Proteus mirabilis]|uniref:hypothetical protein n=1 Tax=Proteus mirabilis TaxID=584 RepID=UPI00374F45F4